MGCATSIVKYLLFLFNLIFVLGALAFIAIGVIFKLNIDGYTESLKSFSVAPLLMIIVGVVVFVIAFFGCCGAIRESSCMLTTYAIILLTIFILQVALGVYAFLQFKSDDTEIKSEIRKELEKTFLKYNIDDVAKEAVDSLQAGVQCCGLDSPADWSSRFWNNGTAPLSCCPDKPKVCYVNSGTFPEGCSPKLFDFLQRSAKIVGIVVIVIAVIELAGAIIGLCLSSSIRNHERRGNYA